MTNLNEMNKQVKLNRCFIYKETTHEIIYGQQDILNLNYFNFLFYIKMFPHMLFKMDLLKLIMNYKWAR